MLWPITNLLSWTHSSRRSHFCIEFALKIIQASATAPSTSVLGAVSPGTLTTAVLISSTGKCSVLLLAHGKLFGKRKNTFSNTELTLNLQKVMKFYGHIRSYFKGATLPEPISKETQGRNLIDRVWCLPISRPVAHDVLSSFKANCFDALHMGNSLSLLQQVRTIISANALPNFGKHMRGAA